MQIARARFLPEQGWQPPLPTELDSTQTLVLAFGPRELASQDALWASLRQAWPASVLAGCSTAGSIAANGVDDRGLELTVVRFERSALRCVSVPLVPDGDAEAAGAQLARMLDPAGLRGVLLLSCGVQVNGAALVRGLIAGLPAQVPISGGLAGDGERFEQTWALDAQGRPDARAVSVVGLYGPALRLAHGCDDGWLDFGPERRVTAAAGPVLKALDDQPALALYKNYLGEVAAELPGAALRFPLSVRQPGSELPVVRTILGIDEAEQSMVFAGDIPQGSVARLMRTNTRRLVHSAGEAARQAMQSLDGLAAHAPVLALAISCIGRRMIMGERSDEEFEAVAEALPPGSAVAGFYSYGEVSPRQGFACAELHNQTMTVTMLAEA